MCSLTTGAPSACAQAASRRLCLGCTGSCAARERVRRRAGPPERRGRPDPPGRGPGRARLRRIGIDSAITSQNPGRRSATTPAISRRQPIPTSPRADTGRVVALIRRNLRHSHLRNRSRSHLGRRRRRPRRRRPRSRHRRCHHRTVTSGEFHRGRVVAVRSPRARRFRTTPPRAPPRPDRRCRRRGCFARFQISQFLLPGGEQATACAGQAVHAEQMGSTNDPVQDRGERPPRLNVTGVDRVVRQRRHADRCRSRCRLPSPRSTVLCPSACGPVRPWCRTRPRRLRCYFQRRELGPGIAAYRPGTVWSGSVPACSSIWPVNRSISGLRTAWSTCPSAVIRPLARRLAERGDHRGDVRSQERQLGRADRLGHRRGAGESSRSARAAAKTTVVANAARYPYPGAVIASAYLIEQFASSTSHPPPGVRFRSLLRASKLLTGPNFRAKPQACGPAEQQRARSWTGVGEDLMAVVRGNSGRPSAAEQRHGKDMGRYARNSGTLRSRA